MMTAARSAGLMRYKKRTSIPSKQPQKRNRSGSSTPDSPSVSASSHDAQQIRLNSSPLLSVPIRKRSGSMPVLKLVTLATVWNLRKEQVRALRMTWARLCEPPRSNCKGIVHLVDRVWEKLESCNNHITDESRMIRMGFPRRLTRAHILALKLILVHTDEYGELPRRHDGLIALAHPQYVAHRLHLYLYLFPTRKIYKSVLLNRGHLTQLTEAAEVLAMDRLLPTGSSALDVLFIDERLVHATCASTIFMPGESVCEVVPSIEHFRWYMSSNFSSQKDPTVRNIFYNAAFVETMNDRCERRRSKGSIATIRDHTHFFVSMISQVVQSLDADPDNILQHIETVGRNHAYLKQYGFRSNQWEKVGEYFLDVVVVQDCVRGFPEACRAWTIMVAALVDRLRAAPRRGSVTPLRQSTQSLIYGSTSSVCALENRRDSTTSNCSPRQDNLPNSVKGSPTDNYPMRRNTHRDSSTGLNVGCMNMASLRASLSSVQANNSTFA